MRGRQGSPGLVTARLVETACHCIAMPILPLYLRTIQCALWTLWLWLVTLGRFPDKMVIV